MQIAWTLWRVVQEKDVCAAHVREQSAAKVNGVLECPDHQHVAARGQGDRVPHIDIGASIDLRPEMRTRWRELGYKDVPAAVTEERSPAEVRRHSKRTRDDHITVRVHRDTGARVIPRCSKCLYP